MRLVVEIGSSQFDVWLATKRKSTGRVLLQMLWRLSGEPKESFERGIARAVDDAFSEFAREMSG